MHHNAPTAGGKGGRRPPCGRLYEPPGQIQQYHELTVIETGRNFEISCRFGVGEDPNVSTFTVDAKIDMGGS